MLVVVVVELLIIPRVLRDILLIGHIPFLRPYQVLSKIISRLGRPIPIRQVQHIPLHQAPVGGLLSLVQELAVGLEIQETGDVVVNDEGVGVVLDGVLEAEVVFEVDQVDVLLLLVLGRFGVAPRDCSGDMGVMFLLLFL